MMASANAAEAGWVSAKWLAFVARCFHAHLPSKPSKACPLLDCTKGARSLGHLPMSSAVAAVEPRPMLDPREPQLLVSRQAPHLILASTPAWHAASGFTERDVAGRAVAVVLQGDGTCVVTAGALWSALQARAEPHEPPSNAPHPPLRPRRPAEPRRPGHTLRALTGRAQLTLHTRHPWLVACARAPAPLPRRRPDRPGRLAAPLPTRPPALSPPLVPLSPL